MNGNFYSRYSALGSGGTSQLVSSLNGLDGALTLVGASGIVITASSPGASDITISGSGLANTTLSNLTSPTAINNSLLPVGSINLGDANGAHWGTLAVNSIGCYIENAGLDITGQDGLFLLANGINSGTGIIELDSDTTDLQPGQNQTNRLRFFESSGVNYTGFKAPESLSVDTMYTLPAANPVGNAFLKNDGSGNLTWAAGTGASGVDAVGALDGQAPSVNGAVIAATTIYFQTATGSNNGMISAADWTTFNGKQAALTIGDLTDAGTDGITVTGGTGAVIGSGTSISQHVADASHNGYLSSTDWSTFNGKQASLTIGNLTDAGTDGITITGGTGAIIGSGTSIAQHVADASHNGYLSSTDWSTFNGKQASGNYITALTGDATASGPGSVALTLATVNLTTGSFGDASHVGAFTVNGKGLVTASSSVAIQITESQVTNLTSDLAAKISTTLADGNILVGNGSAIATSVAMSGDVTIINTGATAIGANKVTDAIIRQSAGLSLVGRSANSTGNVADITASNDGEVLRRSGTAIGFGALSLSTAAAITGTLPVGNGGTGQTSYTNGQLLIGNTSGNTLAKGTLTAGTNVTITNGAGAITIDVNGAAPAYTYVSQSSTLNPAVLGRYYVFSGASFTATLPTAVGVAGQTVWFEHGGTTLSQKYTLATTSSQTIGDVAGGSYLLTTNKEVLGLVSDGANWQIMTHRATTYWTAFPDLTYGTLWTATGTTAAYGTIAVHKAYWRREGQDMLVRWDYRATVAGTAGTGALLFNLFANVLIDTTYCPVNTGVGNSAVNIDSVVGKFSGGANTTMGGYQGYAVPYSTSQLKFFIQAQSATGTADSFGYFGGGGTIDFATNANTSYHFEARFPISDWQP